jgi:hypothetical protein
LDGSIMPTTTARDSATTTFSLTLREPTLGDCFSDCSSSSTTLGRRTLQTREPAAEVLYSQCSCTQNQ